MGNTLDIIQFHNLDCYDIEHLESIKEDIKNLSNYADILFLYESHIDGLFVSDECYSYSQLYCEQCGDSDDLIISDTKEGVINIIDIAIDISKEY